MRTAVVGNFSRSERAKEGLVLRVGFHFHRPEKLAKVPARLDLLPLLSFLLIWVFKGLFKKKKKKKPGNLKVGITVKLFLRLRTF